MNTNIEISNINKYFFSSKERNNEEDNKKYISKLTNYSFNSINEANISDIIKKIPYYSNNYLIVEDYDFVNISQLNDKYIEKLNLSDNKKYLECCASNKLHDKKDISDRGAIICVSILDIC